MLASMNRRQIHELVQAELHKRAVRGGKLRAKSLSPARRVEIASAAANARWSKNGRKGGRPVEKKG